MRLLFTISSCLLICACCADDGWVGYGGVPKLIGSHPSIRMVSEVVVLTIHRRSIHVDARFHFYNAGRDATVRMGFPDQDDGQQEIDDPAPLTPILQNFRSWIGSTPVKTRFVAGKDRVGWHMKKVHISAGDTVLVRDSYSVRPGELTINQDKVCSLASYELDTGASWHGKIRKGTIKVVFEDDLPFTPRRGASILSKVWDEPTAMSPHELLTAGPTKPILNRRTLCWTFKNLKPTEKDNVDVFYWGRPYSQGDRRLTGG